MIILIPGADIGCGLLSVVVHTEGSSYGCCTNTVSIKSTLKGRLCIALEMGGGGVGGWW